MYILVVSFRCSYCGVKATYDEDTVEVVVKHHKRMSLSQLLVVVGILLIGVVLWSCVTAYVLPFLQFTDSRIYDVLARNINDVLHTDRENAGYVVGWLAALLETGKHDDRVPVANWQHALELEWQ